MAPHPYRNAVVTRAVLVNLTSFLIGCYLGGDSGVFSPDTMLEQGALPPTPTKRVVAFSLYGNQTLYTIGAIRNAEMIPALYPGWITRFYIDEFVPREVVERLSVLGAEIVHVDKDHEWMEHGRLWRYLALDDQEVDLVMFRDCDTRISTREMQATNTWLASSYRHHMMRDHPEQIQTVPTGQWESSASIIRSRLSVRTTLASAYRQHPTLSSAALEDVWLTNVIWPVIQFDVLVHDAFNCELVESGSLPFPGPREWHGDYIGRTVVERFDPESDYFINGQREFYGGIVPEECRLSIEHVEG